MCSALCGGILAPKQLSTVKYGGGSFSVCARVLQHWGTVIHEGKHEHFHPNMNYDILKQSMIPFLHKLLGIFQHDNDPKHSSKKTTAFLGKPKVKGADRSICHRGGVKENSSSNLCSSNESCTKNGKDGAQKLWRSHKT